ncbi:G2/M phase-specific E3 ubiquitin-protein ligase-like [Pseudophryne corroboree]|uniref:G2/M phase-specific E3 ubiquitin-protein ligase-like n=1 Tax=Pseudophryne corroboree TaxID=495146 RepID=UPI0030812AB5
MASPSKRRRKTNRDPASSSSEDADPVCVFCGRAENDVAKYGELLCNSKEKLTVHHYCLLLSSGLLQRGSDSQGFYGFLFPDVRKAASWAAEMRCTVCNKAGASIQCSRKGCTQIVHFPCGLQKEFIFQYSKQFPSFCPRHRPVQKAKAKEAVSACTICLEELTPAPAYDVIKSPCCKNTWFHRACLQMQALSAGKYFLKCPICRDMPSFQKEMLRMGIYIPHRDASWELEENAFGELLQVHEQCDVEPCLCDFGRTHSESGSGWSIIRCHCCGSSGSHLACSALTLAQCTWTCAECVSILEKPKEEESLTETADAVPSTSSAPPPPAVAPAGETCARVRGYKVITSKRTRRSPLQHARPQLQ